MVGDKYVVASTSRSKTSDSDSGRQCLLESEQ